MNLIIHFFKLKKHADGGKRPKQTVISALFQGQPGAILPKRLHH